MSRAALMALLAGGKSAPPPSGISIQGSWSSLIIDELDTISVNTPILTPCYLLAAFAYREGGHGYVSTLVSSGGLTFSKLAGGEITLPETFNLDLEFWGVNVPAGNASDTITATVTQGSGMTDAERGLTIIALSNVNASPVGVSFGTIASNTTTEVGATFTGTASGSLLFLVGASDQYPVVAGGTLTPGTGTSVMNYLSSQLQLLRSTAASPGGSVTLSTTGYTEANCYCTGVEIKSA